MLNAKLTAFALVLSISVSAATPQSKAVRPDSKSVTQQPATADDTPATQDQEPAEDQEEPPVTKKKFTPAASLNQALYLASREEQDTAAYLNQAKGMLGQPAA